ncbi:hypothetical protein [Streptomyces sp. ISL-100]|uniref:hypothetical protein n=1 Tax=Streptomyces sp. ISL-100 TaxID=2819173 RepID=UPI002036254B|nr:hypothetical protein [Streptomyces sp. ISL-100]
MLASVATGWLWLMAAAATVIHCSAMAKWIPRRKFRMVYPFIITGCGIGTIAFGQLRGFTLAAMIALYSFSLIGLTVGLFPSRKLFTMWAHELNEGVTRERYDFPRWHVPFSIFCVIVMLIAASVLTR